jgi:hypothetical protein
VCLNVPLPTIDPCHSYSNIAAVGFDRPICINGMGLDQHWERKIFHFHRLTSDYLLPKDAMNLYPTISED